MQWFNVPPNRKRGLHTNLRLTTPAKVREMLLPSMGLRAFGRWVWLKLQRQSANPHKVAAGLALGMWINFLPVPGLGGASALLFAYLLRWNMPAAFIGQLPSNPWTFPFIWAVSYAVGKAVLPVPDDAMGFSQLLANFNWSFLTTHWSDLLTTVLLPLVVGGQILGIPLALGTYWLMRRELQLFYAWRKARANRANQASQAHGG
jgi:uncharacterized protein (DUF2062 family)